MKTIGRELNVRYVLEGSVQRGGNRLRVNVQLVDAQNGKHLWAERFDKPVADLFDMQDEIVARLATQLGTVLIASEARRAERTPNPDAFDLYLQGMAWLDKDPRPVNVAQSRAFFARALAIEPDNVDALIGSAGADFWEAINSENPERAARFASAEASLLKALSTAPDNAMAHMWLSFVRINSNRAARGIADAERALALNRNLPRALMAMGLAKLMVGRAEETEGYLQDALNLSPRDPLAFNWMFMGGMAKIHLGAYEEAARWLSQSVGANPNFPTAHILLAAALSQLGQVEEARAEARAGLVLDPTFTIRRFRHRDVSDNPIFLKQCREHLRRHAQGRSPRAMTATCRLAAILAVDVVGYSRLVSFWWRRMRLGGRIGGFVGALVLLANGATASDVSVERGLRVSIVSGCHDCHTEGYREFGRQCETREVPQGQRARVARAVGHDLCDQPSVDGRASQRGRVRIVPVDLENAASHAVVQGSGDGRERREVALSVHQIAWRSGQTGPDGDWSGRRAYDTLRRARSPEAARWLQARS